jgi:hypothetical protein
MPKLTNKNLKYRKRGKAYLVVLLEDSPTNISINKKALKVMELFCSMQLMEVCLLQEIKRVKSICGILKQELS